MFIGGFMAIIKVDSVKDIPLGIKTKLGGSCSKIYLYDKNI